MRTRTTRAMATTTTTDPRRAIAFILFLVATILLLVASCHASATPATKVVEPLSQVFGHGNVAARCDSRENAVAQTAADLVPPGRGSPRVGQTTEQTINDLGVRWCVDRYCGGALTPPTCGDPVRVVAPPRCEMLPYFLGRTGDSPPSPFRSF